MDGVIMRSFFKLICALIILTAVFLLGALSADQLNLEENLIRLHVVADSNSEHDQQIKLKVRDAITQKLNDVMQQLPDAQTAKAYLQEHLPELETIANDVLKAAGEKCRAIVTLAKESFPTRKYDTFSLPAGVYESLRVTIGSGEGENWWCVVFPRLCVSTTSDGFENIAVGAGFSDSVTGALSGEKEYQVRFWLMDCIGRIQSWLFRR